MLTSARSSCLYLLAGFIAAACAYLLFLEPWGHDTWFHLQRLQDIERQFQGGQWRAHFAENAAQGKGLPVWVYYSQWIYWPAMLLTAAGASPLVALKVVYGAFLVVLCVGVYRLLRLSTDAATAGFVTLLFVTSNYIIGEIFQRSAYAEFLSVAVLPLLLVALHRCIARGSWRAGIVAALLAAWMILCHPLSFMNAGYALAAYVAYLALRWQVPPSRLLRVVPIFVLALALTAFYWLPAVIETRYVLGAEGVPTPLRETFLTVPRYFKFTSVLSLGLVLTSLTLAVAGCLLLRRHVPAARMAPSSWALLAGSAVCVFLTLRLSEPLYTHLPLLASNLWVWRVLFPLSLLVAIFVADNLRALPEPWRGGRVRAAIAWLAVLQAAVFVVWHTASELSARPMAVATIEREVRVESQRVDGFGIDEYLPNPRSIPGLAAKCDIIRTVVPTSRRELRLDIAADDAHACILVPWYWNTRYEASIGGVAVPVLANAAGEMVIVPGGLRGSLVLRLAQPAYVTRAGYLSGVAALLLVVVGGLAVRPDRRAAAT